MTDHDKLVALLERALPWLPQTLADDVGKAASALRTPGATGVTLCPNEATEESYVAIMDAAIADTGKRPSKAAYLAMIACARKEPQR